MEQLIFIGILILFSILESAARKRKQQGTGLPAPREPAPWDQESWEEDRWGDDGIDVSVDDLPSYDGNPTFDDRVEAGASASSEGMIPADIWEEITGLAQDRVPVRREPEEPTLPSSQPWNPPIPPSPQPWSPPAPLGAPRVPEPAHKVHLAHAGYGTDPSTRPPSEQDGLDPLRVRANAATRAVREQLRRGGAQALRQAIILQEVLGPPVVLRDSGPPQ